MSTLESAKALETKGDFKGAFKAYSEAAEAGNAEAQFKVGFYYIFGMNATVLDPKKAVASLEKAVEQKYGPAYGLLAECQLMGIGTARNPAAALKLAEAEEAQNDPFAADVAANILFQGLAGKSNYKRAAELFTKAKEGIAAAAQAGDARGQACYAGLLLSGQSVQQVQCEHWATFDDDYPPREDEPADDRKLPEPPSEQQLEQEEKEGLEWADKAAKQGCAAAQALLAEHYLKNAQFDKAFEFAKAAYDQGEVASYHIMGALAGVGVEGKLEKSMEQAVKYWTEGVEKDDPGSAVALGAYLSQQDGPESKRGANGERSRVAALYEKAAGQADPMGEYLWAATLLNGLYGEETDFKHGLMFLARAAENGHPAAPEILDEIHRQMEAEDEDDEEEGHKDKDKDLRAITQSMAAMMRPPAAETKA